MPIIRNLGVLSLALLSILSCGCPGGSGPKITGVVTLNNEPLADAQVHFDSVDQKGAEVAMARTDAAGKFEVTPRSSKGETLKLGKYGVRITKMLDKSGKAPDEKDYSLLAAAGQLTNSLPAKYNDKKTPAFNVEIKEGVNELPPFDLKK